MADGATTFTWKIKDYDMCPRLPGQAIESPCFSIEPERTTKFSLLLYPRGYYRKEKDLTYVSLFLKRHSDDGEEEVELTVRMWLCNGSCYTHGFEISDTFTKNKSVGNPDFIVMSDRPVFLEEFETDCLTVCALIYKAGSEVETQIYGRDDYDLSSNFGELLANGNHSDLTIRVGEKEFKVHRGVLEHRCPKLMEQLVKLEKSNAYTIPFTEGPSVFQKILKFLYTGQFSDDDEDFVKVFKALNTKDFAYLKQMLFSCPLTVSATTEIDVLNIEHPWHVPKLEFGEEQSCYLMSEEKPEWSWMKISLVKSKRFPDEYIFKFKRILRKDFIILMNCQIENTEQYSRENVSCLFGKDDEFSHLTDIIKSDKQLLVLSFRMSAYNPNSVQPGCPAEDNYSHEQQGFCYPVDKKRSLFRRDLRSLHRNMKNADVTLHVGGRDIPAHRAILSCRSEVFSKMFEHDTKENRTGIVDIDDIDAATMKALLMYMYCSDIDAPLGVASAMKLYSAADKYQVLALKEKCCHFLEGKISSENIGDVLSLVAGAHQDDCLKRSCYSFMSSHFGEILSDEYLLRCLEQ